MPLCPNGCADEFDAPIELEISFVRGREAGVCGCCGYQDLRIGLLCAA